MSIFQAMTAPMIVFLTVVAPLWLILHYRAKKRDTRHLADDERETLDQLTRVAEKMEARINALEQILATEDPAWKDKLP